MEVTDVSSAAKMQRVATVGRDIAAACRATSRAVYGLACAIFPRLRRDGQRRSAQQESADRINHMLIRRLLLRTEREILIQELAEARRLHKATSSLRKRLEAVTTELIALDGPGGAAALSAIPESQV